MYSQPNQNGAKLKRRDKAFGNHKAGWRKPKNSNESGVQVLLLGHAVPMPVVVRTRPYDEQFYKEIGDTAWESMSDAAVFKAAESAIADLGF